MADRGEELIALEGLPDMVVHAGEPEAADLGGEHVRRHGDDRDRPDVAGQAPDALRRGDPVHDRHLDVHQDEIVVVALHPLDRFRAVGRHVDHVAGLFENRAAELLVQVDVLDQEDADGPAGGLGCARRLRNRVLSPRRPAASARTRRWSPTPPRS